MHCGKCGAEVVDTDEFCGKCGAALERPRAAKMVSPRTKLLAVAAVALLVLAGLFGSGLIQQMFTKSPLSLPSQSTSTSPASSSSLTTGRVSAETSNIASTAETTSSTSSLPATSPPDLTSMQNWPSDVGCYLFGQAGWENVTCLSRETVLKYHQFPGHFLGVHSYSPPSSFALPTRLRYGIVMVNIQLFGSETDSKSGDGAYSIQLNTNFFFGNNAHDDWVQFVYQAFPKDGKSFLCVWNVDTQVPEDQAYDPTCVDPGVVNLSEQHTVWVPQWGSYIIGSWTDKGNLIGCGWLNGHHGFVCVVAPDKYGLATSNIGWVEASGGIMGAGDSSLATFENTHLQTDIGATSCNMLWIDCGGQSVSADDRVQEVTGESNNLNQYDVSLTSYYSGSHWWLSSASGCDPATAASPACRQFVGYSEPFGNTGVMLFTVDVQPTGGAVNAGNDVETMVTVTSADGVQVGPITMAGPDDILVSGLSYSDLSDDLSGQTCTFSLPLQPGSSCTFIMKIHTSPAAPPGSYDITIKGTPPPNTGPPPSWQLSANPLQLSNSVRSNAVYKLTINPPGPPSPVIVSPAVGSSLNSGENMLIGYAASTDTAYPGWVPCNRMQFHIAFSDGSTTTATPTEDTSFQQTGYCDATVNLTVQGVATVTLSAANLAGVQGTTKLAVNIVNAQQQPTPFTFALSVTPSTYAIDRGGHGSFTVVVTTTGGVPQPVQLTVSGLPQDATYTLSSNPVTPTATLTLTINAASDTPLGSYTITITGTGGGSTASATVQLAVASLG